MSRRKARRTTVERIRDAHGASSAAPAGLQTKIRRRLGASPAPVELYGPAISILPNVGGPRAPHHSSMKKAPTSSGRRTPLIRKNPQKITAPMHKKIAADTTPPPTRKRPSPRPEYPRPPGTKKMFDHRISSGSYKPITPPPKI